VITVHIGMDQKRHIAALCCKLADIQIGTSKTNRISVCRIPFWEGSPGSAYLRQISEAVKQGIWTAGGMPVEFGIPSTCGNVANGSEKLKYEQVGRDIVAMSIEFVAKVHHFDGLAMIATCDNIIAGTYLVAARLDVPAMVITGGSMQPGNYCGKKIVEAELDVAVLGGESEEKLADMEEHVCPTYGACPSMGTANTIQMLGEVLNLVLPGTCTIPASDNLKIRKPEKQAHTWLN